MLRHKWLMAAGGAAAVLAVGAGVVMAQSTPQSGNGSSFLDRVAQKLGIESPKLQQAVTDVRNEDIDAAVARGDITQEQADKLKQKAAANPEFGQGLGGEGLRQFGMNIPFVPFGGKFFFGLGPGGDAEQKLADYLGISKDQLETELKADNATLASVAQAHGKSTDDLKGFITSTVKATLDQEVTNGHLTQPQEDQAQSQLSSALDRLINNTLPFWGGGGFPGFRGHEPKHGGNHQPPSASPAPQGGSSSSGAVPF